MSGITDHTRQESGDSGLSVSISQTPDFLSTIDDDSMDGVNANGKIKRKKLSCFKIIMLRIFIDSSLDVMESFNEAMETPDDFMVC